MPKGKRKIHKFDFHFPGFPPVEVPVYVNTNGDQALMSASLSEHNVYCSDYNLKELRVKVEAALKATFALDFKPYLYVEFDGQTKPPFVGKSGYSLVDCSLSIEPVLLAQRGENKYRQYVNEESRGKGIKNGWPATGVEYVDYKEKKVKGVKALIPDTPEHRAALGELISTMQRIFDRLLDLLEPSKIRKTLAQTSGVLALQPAPTTARASKKGRKK